MVFIFSINFEFPKVLKIPSIQKSFIVEELPKKIYYLFSTQKEKNAAIRKFEKNEKKRQICVIFFFLNEKLLFYAFLKIILKDSLFGMRKK